MTATLLRVTMLDERGKRIPASPRMWESGLSASIFAGTIPPEREPHIESVLDNERLKP